MGPEYDARLRKIKGVSGILQGACIGFFANPTYLVLQALWAVVTNQSSLPGIDDYRFTLDEYMFSANNWYASSRVLIGAYLTLRCAAMLLCAYCLIRLLRNFSRGEIFTKDSVRRLRLWGIACVLWGTMKLLFLFIPGGLLIYPVLRGTEAMHRGIQGHNGDFWINGAPISSHGGNLMMIGLIIVAISWFMEMAAEMREENELTV
jgi:hypothetical protein